VSAQALQTVLQTIENAARRAGRPTPRLLAVSKRQPATAIADLAALWRSLPPGMTALAGEQAPAFGENYVQEAKAKQAALSELPIEWHLIGHLQSNKAADAAAIFDWVQTVDRPALVEALGRHRAADRAPLDVLVQVNIDDETSKHGCHPDAVDALAAAIAAQSTLALRGLMAIPAPYPDLERRRTAFRRTRALFDALQRQHPQVDTLSMGMSEDFAIAIEEGSTMVRLGTALFGQRPPREQHA
jgi:pyridoxal phosphate enzyme (YggS family)